ncbi:protoporphyrinogen oxidase [Thioalkalivibrio sp.]|uniref:protoporphyrinogen oxidase n=1 Tax=Thioalkalivibrio sp. TaxID=2093813 RepID=UPI003565D61D
MRTAIIGAGISGLTTAFYLRKADADREIHLFDVEPIPGGTMRTDTLSGFHFEAGGNGFLTNKPHSMQLVKDSGAEELLLPSSDAARKRYIYTDRLHQLPEAPLPFLRTRLIGMGAKLRMAGEFFVPKRREEGEETLQAFGYRRVGKKFTDVFLDAMTAGIYATTPDKVSVNAAFPLVVSLEREHGGLFRGMIARRKKQAGPGGILMSFKGGVGTFIEHLQRTIPAEWHLGAPVTEVAREDGGYRVRAGDYEDVFEQVVISTQAHAAAAMLQGMDGELAQRLAGIEYSPVAVVGLGWKQLDHPLDGFGLLTTTSAKLPVLGVLWDSSIFPDRAPEGSKSVRVMIGGQRDPGLVQQDEAGLIATARDGVRITMGVEQDPDVTFVQRWDNGIPSYRVGHIASVDAIFEHLERYPGLHLGGNAYRGIAMNDCVRNGRELAEKLAQAEG